MGSRAGSRCLQQRCLLHTVCLSEHINQQITYWPENCALPVSQIVANDVSFNSWSFCLKDVNQVLNRLKMDEARQI